MKKAELDQGREEALRRYVAAFKQYGFDGLLPRERNDKGSCKAIPAEALKMAAEMRQELPARSAERIQQMLASEGYSVARSTLERQLRQQGLSGREIKAEQKQVVSRRFNRVGRNTLWQSDYPDILVIPTFPQELRERFYFIKLVS
jgi:putative transposase